VIPLSAPYLLIKADATEIPLSESSIGLVIGTPPHLGEPGHRREFCTSNEEEYDGLIARFLSEAARIVEPRGYVLLNMSRTRRRNPKVFRVLQKRARRGESGLVTIRLERFRAHHANVKDFAWEAFPLRLYRTLIRRYSQAGAKVAHVFSGSGNGGIAALELGRKPILIDLHYHRQMRKRLSRIAGPCPRKAARRWKRR
jgi:hypothetical protein